MKLSEHAVQSIAVALLRRRGVRFFAVPNGGLRTKATAAKLWREGVESGVPDLIIIDPPPRSVGRYVGMVVEVKAQGGRATPEQLRWVQDFAQRGWVARIPKGEQELLNLLVEFGYLEDAAVAPYLRPTAAAADAGSVVRDQPAVRQSRTVPAPSVPTSPRKPAPSRGKVGEG